MAEGSPTPRRRSYHSPLRAAQAAAKREAVIAAAYELFLERGYGGTTLEDVARKAGVSKPTVIAAVGSKAELLKLVRDVAIVGDYEQRALQDRDGLVAVAAEPDLHRSIVLAARHHAAVMERYAPIYRVLRGATGVEPGVDELWKTSEIQRRTGAEDLVCRIGKPVIPLRKAVDRLWILMTPGNYDRLVNVCGWSKRAYEQWLVEEMSLLFEPRR